MDVVFDGLGIYGILRRVPSSIARPPQALRTPLDGRGTGRWPCGLGGGGLRHRRVEAGLVYTSLVPWGILPIIVGFENVSEAGCAFVLFSVGWVP